MAIQLLVKVISVSVDAGSSVTVPHGLLSKGKPVKPTLIQPDQATPVYVDTANTLTAVLTNPDTIAHTAKFRFEYGLSNELNSVTVGESYWQGVTTTGAAPVTIGDLGDVPVTAPTPTPVTLGEPVAVVGGQLIPADATSIATGPAVGFMNDPASNLVRTSGVVVGLSGLPADTTIYLAVGGGITATPPGGSGNIVQTLGYTIGTTAIFVSVGDPIIL